MENRFTVKDLIMCSMLTAVFVIALIAMWQTDRQWDKVIRLQATLDAQTKDVLDIKASLRQGVQPQVMIAPQPPVTPTQTATVAASGPPKRDAFSRIRQAQANADYARGDWLVDVFGATVAKITPLVSVDVYGARIQGHVLESLCGRDPNTFEWLPALAKSWKVNDNGMTIVFQVREDVTFSDGEPMTAEDFQYTHDLIMNESIDDPRDREQEKDLIESIKATGKYEVTFKFKKPYFESFAMAAGYSPLPKHFYSKYTPQQINEMPGLLLGTGPYRMEDPAGWTPSKELVLYRNERYWGEPSAFDRVVYKVINDDTARQAAFQNRESDYFPAQPVQYLKMLKDKQILERTQHFELTSVNSGYSFIAWNQARSGKPTIFADRRVRQAMTLMIDRQRIMDEVFLGFGIGIVGPFNPLTKQNDPSLKPWPFDIAKSKALLIEAGFKEDAKLGMIAPDGQPFKFTLTYPSGSSQQDKIMLMIKDSMAKVGVKMELEPLEWSVFDPRIKSRDFDAITMGWSGGIEGDVWQMFHSSQIQNQADNFTSYNNPKLDALIDEARATTDEAKRMPIWQKISAILYEDQPYTFLYTRKSLSFLDNRIKNVEVTKLGLNDKDEWYVPRARQFRGQP